MLKVKHLPESEPHTLSESSQVQNDIDLQPILAECMGNTELLKKLIQLFHQNALEFLGAAKIHLPKANYHDLGLAAHKVIAGLAMMRTPSLHAIAVQVKKECDNANDLKHVQFLCSCFKAEYPAVKIAVNKALKAVLSQG